MRELHRVLDVVQTCGFDIDPTRTSLDTDADVFSVEVFAAVSISPYRPIRGSRGRNRRSGRSNDNGNDYRDDGD